MTGWAADQKTPGTMLKLLGDPTSAFTKALDLVFDDPGAMEVLGNPRCKRFSMLVDDGIIKTITVAEGDVPADDTFAEKMLTQIGSASAARGLRASGPLSSFAERPSAFKAPSHAFGAQPLGAHQALSHAQPLSARVAPPPRMAAQRAPTARFAQRPMYEEMSAQEDDPVIVAITGVVSFFVGSGITLAVHFLRQRALRAAEKPLLAA